jgi:hypothetical protein
MSEAYWLACDDPASMLEYLRSRASNRRLRLFAVACCRKVWPYLQDQRSRQAVETAESYADGQISIGSLLDASEAAESALYSIARPVRKSGRDERRALSAVHAAALSRLPTWNIELEPALDLVVEFVRELNGGDSTSLLPLLRCIFGNPWRPIAPGPWITPAAVTVAQDIYDRRDFTALPLLADLLEEAGCPEQSVLDHCRQPGEHARGCHVVDLVLGKQ